MIQTAIIVRHGGHDILVRLYDVHVPADKIKVDWRPNSTAAWAPKLANRVEVRLENG